jgi:hypothetical protein
MRYGYRKISPTGMRRNGMARKCRTNIGIKPPRPRKVKIPKLPMKIKRLRMVKIRVPRLRRRH